MNQYVVGTVIKKLRENRKLTQLELAERLLVSDKTYQNGRREEDIEYEPEDYEILYLEQLISREKNPEFKEALQDLDDFMLGY